MENTNSFQQHEIVTSLSVHSHPAVPRFKSNQRSVELIYGPFNMPDKMTTSRILIADDNQANCELLEAYLSEIDCEVAMAVDGAEAIDKVASFRPDVILLDIMMPKFNGFEVCEKIKSNESSKNVMVLMVTALNELGDIERAVRSGTDDFLSKPVNKVELLKRVSNMLKLRDVHDENERLRQYIEEMESGSKQ